MPDQFRPSRSPTFISLFFLVNVGIGLWLAHVSGVRTDAILEVAVIMLGIGFLVSMGVWYRNRQAEKRGGWPD